MGFIPVIGPRQDFTFKRGPTYLIYSPVELYGHTVIQGASVIKFDTWTNATLQIKGSLSMDTSAYAPGILTCMDDNSVGIPISGQQRLAPYCHQPLRLSGPAGGPRVAADTQQSSSFLR